MYVRVALWKTVLCSAAITLAAAATAGAVVTVSQKPQNFKYNGATGNIGVTFTQISTATVALTAEKSVGWITLIAPASGTLPVKKGKAVGKVQYRVAANDSSLNRSGSIGVNGTSVPVNQ